MSTAHLPSSPTRRSSDLNREPVAGVAVIVTDVPYGKSLVHATPQLMPSGAVLTAPPQLPAFLAPRDPRSSSNVAVTERAWVMSTVQLPVPEHAPAHPTNR